MCHTTCGCHRHRRDVRRACASSPAAPPSSPGTAFRLAERPLADAETSRRGVASTASVEREHQSDVCLAFRSCIHHHRNVRRACGAPLAADCERRRQLRYSADFEPRPRRGHQKLLRQGKKSNDLDAPLRASHAAGASGVAGGPFPAELPRTNFRIILRRTLSPSAWSSISDSFARDAPANHEGWDDALRASHNLVRIPRCRGVTLDGDASYRTHRQLREDDPRASFMVCSASGHGAPPQMTLRARAAPRVVTSSFSHTQVRFVSPMTAVSDLFERIDTSVTCVPVCVCLFRTD